MSDQPSNAIQIKCTRCKQVFGVTDDDIKALLAEQQPIHKAIDLSSADAATFEINVTCPICAQVNVVTLRNKKTS